MSAVTLWLDNQRLRVWHLCADARPLACERVIGARVIGARAQGGRGARLNVVIAAH